MARKKNSEVPTDKEILAMESVPTNVAGLYIGMSATTLTNALRQQRAPFGFAVRNEELGTWAYNISPGLLVAYKRGTLPAYQLKDIINLAAEGVDRVIEARMSGMNKITEAIGKALGA